jgi:membrane protein YqaA with SNARE-associated domain
MSAVEPQLPKPPEGSDKYNWISKILENRILQIITLVVVVALTVVIFIYGNRLSLLAPLGYTGAFLISLIGSASIVAPVPAWIIIAALGHSLNPWMVGLVATVGGTFGEMTGYALGFGGRIVLEKIPHYTSLVKWMRRWGSPTIFVLALIPNPLFDVAGAAAGGMRYPVWKFLLWGGLGRLPKTMLYAYLGVWSWEFLTGIPLWIWLIVASVGVVAVGIYFVVKYRRSGKVKKV